MNYNVPSDWATVIIKKSTIKTMNNYNKKDAIEGMFDCMTKGAVTDANYWAAELLASGFYLPLWDSLFKFYFQNVHYFNVNIINYLNEKYELFNQIKKLYTNNLKNLCNNQELRNHLAEIVTILCMCKKQKLIIQEKITIFEIDVEMIGKTDKVINLIAPYLSQESIVYQQFRSFIVNYYYDDVDNCTYYINWFISDNDYTITSFDEFSLPPSIGTKSVWLLWKFMLLQYRSLKNSFDDEEYEQMLVIFELLIHLFVIINKRKDKDTCINILTLIIFISKCPQGINWSKIIDVRSHHVIKQCANINLIYQHLQKSHNKISKESNMAPKKGRISKKDSSKQKFYENDKNKSFITLLNDTDAIMTKTQIKKKNNNHENDSNKSYLDGNEEDDHEGDNDDNNDDDNDNDDDDNDDNDDSIMSIKVPKVSRKKRYSALI